MKFRKFSDNEKKFINLFSEAPLKFDKIRDFYTRHKININAFEEDSTGDGFRENLLTEILFGDVSGFTRFDIFRIFDFFEECGFDFNGFSASILSQVHFFFREEDILTFIPFILSKLTHIHADDFAIIAEGIGSEASYLRVCECNFHSSNILEVALKMVEEFHNKQSISISEYCTGLIEKISILEVSDFLEGFEITLNGQDNYLVYDGVALYLSKRSSELKKINTIKLKEDTNIVLSQIRGRYLSNEERDCRIMFELNLLNSRDEEILSVIGFDKDERYTEKVVIADDYSR